MSRPRPALFFDRDGVVNQSPGRGYVLQWEAFAFSPGLFELLRAVKENHWWAILVTSQKGVGKGLMSAADLETIHSRMQETLRSEVGFTFDAIYAYTGEADCTHQPKPDPEMILSAAERFEIDLNRSWMIGDADRDIEMGQGAGLAGTIRVRGDKPIGVKATTSVDTLEAARDFLRPFLTGESRS